MDAGPEKRSKFLSTVRVCVCVCETEITDSDLFFTLTENSGFDEPRAGMSLYHEWKNPERALTLLYIN